MVENENSIAIFTSQSGETADTLASLRKANEYGIVTVSISNEPESSMIAEAQTPIITRGDTETLNGIFGFTINQAKGKPTNSEFVAMISDKLRLTMRNAS